MPETKPYYQARFSSSASTALYSRALASTSSSITKSAPYCTVSPLPPLFTLSLPILQVKYGGIYLPSSFLAVRGWTCQLPRVACVFCVTQWLSLLPLSHAFLKASCHTRACLGPASCPCFSSVVSTSALHLCGYRAAISSRAA